MRFSSIRKPVVSAVAFFGTLGILSTGYAAYVALSDVAANSPLRSSDWNTMVADLADHETRIGTLASQVSSIVTGGGNPWAAVSGGLSYTGGKVGIGTSAPNRNLHIYDTSANAEINIQSTSANQSHWSIYHNAGDQSLRFWHGDNLMSMLPNGNVGIGTVTPSTMLQVTNGSGYGAIAIGANSSAGSIITNETGGDFGIWNGPYGSGLNRLMIKQNGNVGIGTTSPAGAVHISKNYNQGTWLKIENTNTQSTWGTVAIYDSTRYISVSGGNELSKTFNVGAGGVGIGYNPPTYARNGVDALYVNGNVGIGTTTPAHKLDVVGSVNATSICIAGDCKSAWPGAASGGSVTGDLSWSAPQTAATYDAAWNVCLAIAPAGQWRLPTNSEIERGRRVNSSLFTGNVWTSTPSGYQGYNYGYYPVAGIGYYWIWTGSAWSSLAVGSTSAFRCVKSVSG